MTVLPSLPSLFLPSAFIFPFLSSPPPPPPHLHLTFPSTTPSSSLSPYLPPSSLPPSFIPPLSPPLPSSLSLPSSYILPTPLPSSPPLVPSPLPSSLHSSPSRWVNVHPSWCGHLPSHTTPTVQAASTADAPTTGVGTAATERAEENPQPGTEGAFSRLICSTSAAEAVEDCKSWWLSGCHGRALAAQSRVLGSIPVNCRPFHFPLFHLITSLYFQLKQVSLPYMEWGKKSSDSNSSENK